MIILIRSLCLVLCPLPSFPHWALSISYPYCGSSYSLSLYLRAPQIWSYTDEGFRVPMRGMWTFRSSGCIRRHLRQSLWRVCVSIVLSDWSPGIWLGGRALSHRTPIHHCDPCRTSPIFSQWEPRYARLWRSVSSHCIHQRVPQGLNWLLRFGFLHWVLSSFFLVFRSSFIVFISNGIL